jgi:tRNA (mo5U34)-methyltransferase
MPSRSIKKILRNTERVSDQIRIVRDVPPVSAGPRGDVEAFLAETRSTLERFPGMAGTAQPGDESDLAKRARSVFWYHTIELGDGITTDGIYDHRPLVPHYGLPEDLQGKRALDVGTWDGFWAFELERRGATVTAMDVEGLHQVDIPEAFRRALDEAGLREYYGEGFAMAKQARSSSVDRVLLNVYDLSPKRLGTFDFVHMGDLVLHLEFPTKALRAVRSVTDGQALICIPFDPELEGQNIRYYGGWWNVVWWIPSLDAAAQMIYDAGFSKVEVSAVYELQSPHETEPWWRAVFRATP